jgi:hypothetical protein
MIHNPEDTKEVLAGVTYRNLSITETPFVSWSFRTQGGLRCRSYVYSALAHVHC